MWNIFREMAQLDASTPSHPTPLTQLFCKRLWIAIAHCLRFPPSHVNFHKETKQVAKDPFAPQNSHPAPCHQSTALHRSARRFPPPHFAG